MKEIAAGLIIGMFIAHILNGYNKPECKKDFIASFDTHSGWICLAGYKP